MGAINYGTSQYITMGFIPYDFDECKRAELEFFMDECPEMVNNDGDIDDSIVYEYMNDCEQDDFNNANSIINKYDIHYYMIELKPVYYSGAYLDIEDRYGIAFDDWTDRAEAQKDITKIKAMLYELAGIGMVKCAPGWGTSYSDYSGTIAAIDEVIKDMRNEARTKPTWRQYLIDCGEWDYKQERAWRRVYA